MLRERGGLLKRLLPNFKAVSKSDADTPRESTEAWEYKVVQMFSQTPADATDASKKLGGALSPEGLRNQFPEHYSVQDGRKQINDFLNKLGHEGWELIEVQQIMNLPLMILKRKISIKADYNSTQTN